MALNSIRYCFNTQPRPCLKFSRPCFKQQIQSTEIQFLEFIYGFSMVKCLFNCTKKMKLSILTFLGIFLKGFSHTIFFASPVNFRKKSAETTCNEIDRCCFVSLFNCFLFNKTNSFLDLASKKVSIVSVKPINLMSHFLESFSKTMKGM